MDQSFVDVLAGGASSLVTQVLEQCFGPAVTKSILGPYSWADLAVLAFLLVLMLLADALVALIVHQKHKKADEPKAGQQPDAPTWKHRLLSAIHSPVHLFIWICGCYVGIESLLLKVPASEGVAAWHRVVDTFFDVVWFAALVWLFVRLTHVLEARLHQWAAKTSNKWDDLIVTLLVRTTRIIVPVMGVIFALPMLGLPAKYANAVSHASSILIIVSVAWVLIQAVHTGEDSVLSRYDLKAADNLRARRMYTQVHFLSRVCYVVITIFTIASILMLFEEVRRLGTSILASAGVLSVVAGLAAQNTIGNLIAGFQLAISQPMRIDDVLIVQGNWGRVEEITFTYVVLHIWDDTRLIIPLSWFIQNPFQNWTRNSAYLLGSVIIYMDYSVPVAELRQAVKQIVESAPLWDKRFWNLQVSDATEHTMQLRVLCTAADSSKAWDLRCDVRERVIDYIQQHYPHGLPRTRVDFKNLAAPVANGPNGSDGSSLPESNGRSALGSVAPTRA